MIRVMAMTVEMTPMGLFHGGGVTSHWNASCFYVDGGKTCNGSDVFSIGMPALLISFVKFGGLTTSMTPETAGTMLGTLEMFGGCIVAWVCDATVFL